MKWAYYNEFNPKSAAWLRELIKQKLIADGEVDERSIADVRPDDLKGFRQVHCFAGIGGWSLALRLAGWPDDRPVWTASCPCQSFSCAGKGDGVQDARDLWPTFHSLSRECRPSEIFGEQVTDAIEHGWLDRLEEDLEKEGYSVGSVVLGAFSVESPQKRKRLYWGASDSKRKRVARLEQGKDSSFIGQWGWRGQEDLQALVDAPLERGRVWPQPIVCRVDDGLPSRVASLHGYGNAIVPQVAAEFIRAFCEAVEESP